MTLKHAVGFHYWVERKTGMPYRGANTLPPYGEYYNGIEFVCSECSKIGIGKWVGVQDGFAYKIKETSGIGTIQIDVARLDERKTNTEALQSFAVFRQIMSEHPARAREIAKIVDVRGTNGRMLNADRVKEFVEKYNEVFGEKNGS